MEDEGRPGAERAVTRRAFLAGAARGAVALSAVGTLLAACSGGEGGGEADELDVVRWVSPRGSLDVMDDYHLWVAIEQGYFRELGVEARLLPGSADATATTSFLAARRADVGYPSAGVLTAAIDRGTRVVSVWDQHPAQLFDFALPEDSPITRVQELEGRTIAVGSASWEPILAPILVEAGVDPDSVTLLEAGLEWGQAAARGRADAALAWEGLRAQWMARGLKLKYLLGSEFSKGPSGVYAVRRADLEDERLRDLVLRFLRGVVMGLEFGKANPRAAAQIAYRRSPALAETLRPQVALASMAQLAAGYGATARAGHGWGFHDSAAWDPYLATLADLGQTSRRLTPEQVYTNELVGPANAGADVARARRDAEAFELDADFAKTALPEGVAL